MIPENHSFHDATVATIEREGTSYALGIEDVAVDDGEEVVDGTLFLDGVSRILVDDSEARELAMAGDDGEILELQELPGPTLRVFVIWRKYPSQDETNHLYLIECKDVRWEADE